MRKIFIVLIAVLSLYTDKAAFAGCCGKKHANETCVQAYPKCPHQVGDDCCDSSGGSGGGSTLTCSESECTGTKPTINEIREFDAKQGGKYTCTVASTSCQNICPDPTPPINLGGDVGGLVSIHKLLNYLSPIQSACAGDFCCQWVNTYTDCKCSTEGYKFTGVVGNATCVKTCTSAADCGITSETTAGGIQYTCYQCIDGVCSTDQAHDVSCKDGYYRSGDSACSACSSLPDKPTGLISVTYSSYQRTSGNKCGQPMGYGYNGSGDCRLNNVKFTDTYGSGKYNSICPYE